MLIGDKSKWQGARSVTRSAEHNGTTATLYMFLVSQRLMLLLLERATRSDGLKEFASSPLLKDKDVGWFSRGALMSKVYPS